MNQAIAILKKRLTDIASFRDNSHLRLLDASKEVLKLKKDIAEYDSWTGETEDAIAVLEAKNG